MAHELTQYFYGTWAPVVCVPGTGLKKINSCLAGGVWFIWRLWFRDATVIDKAGAQPKKSPAVSDQGPILPHILFHAGDQPNAFVNPTGRPGMKVVLLPHG